MGDIADWLLDQYDFGDLDNPDYPGVSSLAASYAASFSDDDLKKHSSKARTPKIMSIRKWPHKLSDKQRWCLAFWIANNELMGS